MSVVSRMAAQAALMRRIRGVVFDMDGTLTCHGAIDFSRMRERLGIEPGHGLLEHLNSLEGEEFKQANAIIEEEEALGLDRCELQSGLPELLKFLDDAQIPKAVLTRNSTRAMEHFLRKLPDPLSEGAFSPCLSREFSGGFKPSPAPLYHIAEQWSLDSKDLLMVGDMSDDIACGKNASSLTCLVRHSENTTLARSGSADFLVSDLREIITVIESANKDTDKAGS